MPFEHGFIIEVALLLIYSKKAALFTKSALCKEYEKIVHRTQKLKTYSSPITN